MNYKIATYILLVCFVGSLVYIFFIDRDQCYNRITEGLYQELTKKKFDRLTGEAIHWEDAKEGLDLYKAKFNVDCDREGKVDLYGFAFGMEEYRTFSNKVFAMDDSLSDNEKLLGIRVYLSLKKDTILNTGQMYHDVFLVPVAMDGDNIYDELDDCTKVREDSVGFVNDDRLILNTSMLCPNQCQ